jgi:cobyrinic acid a,c-diamide synthase
MSHQEIQDLYQKQACLSDISIIEGNKGLYDGMNTQGGDANADLAKLLKIPVILVIDTIGTTRGVAALVNGYQSFDKQVDIQGVILNKVAGSRHESKLISALEYYCDIEVLGAVRKNKDLIINERHLGLMPANEMSKSQVFIDQAAHLITEQVDLKKLLNITQQVVTESNNPIKIHEKKLSIAIAKDAAFGFYYPDDLQKFRALGVEIKFFNTLKDTQLPMCDGLFIGGGFPEMHLKALSDNQILREDIKQKIENGLPTYAECGGLMYLSRSISGYAMVGVIGADSIMGKKPFGRGYVQLEALKEHPWSVASKRIYAHEFHYSKLENIDKNTRYAYQVLRGEGVDNKQDGILKYNMLASYTHLRNVNSNTWVQQFVDFIKRNMKK